MRCSKKIFSLDLGKKVSGSIPTSVFKMSAAQCAPVLTKCFNSMIIDGTEFPYQLCLADIIPSFKGRGSDVDRGSYRPISLLPIPSKVFERIIVRQLSAYFDPFLSKFLCGFRKGYSCQYALLSMLHRWQKSLSLSGKVGAVLMDLSKAFDCMSHDLLIAKLAAYGVGYNTLRLLHSYLTNRKHRVRVGSIFSEWLEMLIGVPQGSVLGPILFNIFINDLLFVISDCMICNFADDNTLYSCAESIDDIFARLKKDLTSVVYWFENNGMVANSDKFQMLVLGCDYSDLKLYFGPVMITPSDVVKLLGIILDSKLTFYPHVKEMCRKASSKTKVLYRIRRYLNESTLKILFNTFILPCFNYCPLVWMFCGKQAHNLVEKTYRRALCASGLLQSPHTEGTRAPTVHSRNLLLLLLEVFKSVHRLNPPLMWDIFETKSLRYGLRQGHTLKVPRSLNSVGLNSFEMQGSLAWNGLPSEIKKVTSFSEFRSAISASEIYCRCKLCVANVEVRR